MNIGFTINNTLRDHVTKLQSIYLAITQKEVELPINPFELDVHFPNVAEAEDTMDFDENANFVEYTEEDIDSITDIGDVDEGDKAFDVYQFIYIDAAFEVFGSCDEACAGGIKKLSELAKTSEHNIVLTNLESTRSKSATLYFLSKNFFDLKEIYFPETREDMWNKFDVIVTDDPKIIALKPEGKFVIKINNPFNTDSAADLSLDNISELITNLDHYINQLS